MHLPLALIFEIGGVIIRQHCNT